MTIGQPYGHHAKCDVLAASVISAPHLLTFEITTIFFEDKKIKSLILNGNLIGLMLWIKNDLVNLVCLGHNNTVPLNNHCVCVHPALKSDDDDDDDDDVKCFDHLDLDFYLDFDDFDFFSPLTVCCSLVLPLSGPAWNILIRIFV